MNKKTIGIAGAGGTVSIALIITLIAVLGKSNKTATNNTTSTKTSTTGSSQNTQVDSQSYKDGEYSASTNYSVPRGATENIEVKLTLKDNIVTSVQNTHVANEHESEQYQNWFEAAIQQKVVGKRIDEVNLSRVGGASLTTEAFKKALSIIKTEAINV